MTRLSKASPARKKAIRNRRQRRQTKPIRTAGKSALRRNPQDPAFGRGEQTCQHRLDRKHPQNPVSKLKLHARLRITGPPTKQKLKLQNRIAKTKPSLPRLKRIPVLDCFVAVVETVGRLRETPGVWRKLLHNNSCVPVLLSEDAKSLLHFLDRSR